ncbi:unnamed protein product [Closterium sp. Naga37s-1]|nr:unnamed protein product [Closterium sp. Naga37s-1]
MDRREHLGTTASQGHARRAAAGRARAGLPAARVEAALPARPPAHRLRLRHARAQAPHRPCAPSPAGERADLPALDSGEAAALLAREALVSAQPAAAATVLSGGHPAVVVVRVDVALLFFLTYDPR